MTQTTTTTSMREQREQMVDRQIRARGVTDDAVLRTMGEVPREEFVPEALREFAYIDAPLPIAEGQTISQPYIVALEAAALELKTGDRVLEVGAGSGYAAAVLGRLASRVITVERHASLANEARGTLQRLGYDNVDVIHADGREGWPQEAPYDAIVVTAAGAEIPRPLLEQLAIGGRLVIPVGEEGWVQELRRLVRRGEHDYDEDDLGEVQFVPLLPGLGEKEERLGHGIGPLHKRGDVHALPARLVEAAQAVGAIDTVDLSALLDRIGDARLVLIGEASHGTSEFYRMRQRITQELLEQRGFSFVAAEADWPDAARIDNYVRRGPGAPEQPEQAFARFPTWMWRNTDVLDFVDWLRAHNDARAERGQAKAAFYGMDLYSLYSSIGEVLDYLDDVDPEAAQVARQRYGCLEPYQSDPAQYGLAAITGRYAECEDEVVANLKALQEKRGNYATGTGEAFLDAEQNARIAVDAERYYRAMYYGSAESWNLRDRHMVDTLEALLTFHGPESKAVVWAHNSHLGDARATEMSARGELNVGQLVRERFGSGSHSIGFGTDHGTVAAADEWDGPMQVMQVRPSNPRSYERVCHDSGEPAFILPLRRGQVEAELRRDLGEARLERAIGVIYRPDTELLSHYFRAELPSQFDEYVWFDETTAVEPIGRVHAPEIAEGHPLATLDR